MGLDRPREEASGPPGCDHEEPPGTPCAACPAACKLLDMLKDLSGESPYVFPGPRGRALSSSIRATRDQPGGAPSDTVAMEPTCRFLPGVWDVDEC
jgi:hypothetical protein